MRSHRKCPRIRKWRKRGLLSAMNKTKQKNMKATLPPSYVDIKLVFLILPKFIGVFCDSNI
jgi:hypothetical protein